MFKKKCPKCENKINKNYDFCPHCGKNFKSEYEEEDYGLLGKNDVFNKPVSGFGDSMIDKMFSGAVKSAVKMLEKQMKDLPKGLNENQGKFPSQIPNNLKVQFFVNGKKILPENTKNNPNNINNEKAPIKRFKQTISKEKQQIITKLPKKEPLSKVRRLSGKIIYELEVPGVKNIEDILINQLENSIEIKALSKTKVYHKTLNINLPILGYQLEKDNLILELKTEDN